MLLCGLLSAALSAGTCPAGFTMMASTPNFTVCEDHSKRDGSLVFLSARVTACWMLLDWVHCVPAAPSAVGSSRKPHVADGLHVSLPSTHLVIQAHGLR